MTQEFTFWIFKMSDKTAIKYIVIDGKIFTKVYYNFILYWS